MKHMRWIVAAALAAASLEAAVAESESAWRARASADVREGPASYFRIAGRVEKGMRLSGAGERRGWREVTVEQLHGWAPRQALEPWDTAPAKETSTLRSAMDRALAGLSGKRPTSWRTVSAAQLSAGIRGFAEAYLRGREGASGKESVAPELFNSPAFTEQEYKGFIEERFPKLDAGPVFADPVLGGTVAQRDLDATDKLGVAVGARLAQIGLVRDPALEAYLSMIATLVAESSHSPELAVRVFVLDDAKPRGYVTPHGVIFVSKGVLQLMRNEAEFAFFAGHELAHVIFQHGLRKQAREKQRMQESESFDELDRELGWDERKDDRYVEVNRELMALADEVHDYFQSEANDADELDADRWGLTYAVRAGYRGHAAIEFLQRLQSLEKKDATAESLLWRGTPSGRRVQELDTPLGALARDPRGKDFDLAFREKTRKGSR